MSYRFTILGCGSSAGVPRIGNDWGSCDPRNPRNRRRRATALVQRRETGHRVTALIDTGPDLREQLLEVGVGRIDGVVYTHDHADHTHGIDDLRMVAYTMKRRVDVWFDAATRDSMLTRFGYCFSSRPGSSYPPILIANEIRPPEPVRVAGERGYIDFLPIVQEHGEIPSLGFRIADLAYSPDVSGLSESSAAMLLGLDVWIVNALRYTPHPSHFTVGQALEWIAKLKPKRAILTHLHIDLDYETLKRELPANVEPAYDGMVIEF